MNTAIALVNACIAGMVLWLGVLCAWKARRWWRNWPMSAMIATGSVFVGVGAILIQTVLFRLVELPDVVAQNGAGTLLLRIGVLVATTSLTRRILVGELLTESDRQHFAMNSRAEGSTG